jgi:hypothetical protein
MHSARMDIMLFAEGLRDGEEARLAMWGVMGEGAGLFCWGLVGGRGEFVFYVLL